MAALVQRFSEWAKKAGLQYGGKRDVETVAGYLPSGKEQFADYDALVRRNEIAGRIVELPAEATWRTPPEIVEADTPNGTEFTTAFAALAKRLDLWRELEGTDVLSGIGQYAVLLLGTRGTDDQALVRPAAPLGRPEDLIYLKPYDEGAAEIETFVTNPGDPRFGLPETYRIRTSGGVKNFPSAQLRVHWSRVLHVAEGALRDRVFGRPRLRRALNRLFDLEKIAAGVGEGFWQAATPILQAEIDPAADISDDDQNRLVEEMAEMVHDLRRQFMGRGAKLSWLPVGVNPPKEIGDFYFALIAAATGIPRRILFGNEVGELASTTDQATFFGSINSRQEQFAEPLLVRAFVDRMIAWRVLPRPASGEYQVIWPSLFELTELETADANLKRAQAAAALTPMGGDPMDLVEVDEDRNVWLVEKKPKESVNPDEVLPPP